MSGETSHYLVDAGEIELNPGRRTATIMVANTGDRAIQVGSHFHFFEVNRALRFDRQAAFGMRLNIPAGTAVRFEPGDEKPVDLVAIGGTRRVIGLNGLLNGSVDALGAGARAFESLMQRGFGHSAAEGPQTTTGRSDGPH
jgi:urease beta subunit